MAMTGKIEMGNMVNSIIADLMRMTVKSTITEPLFAFIKTVLPIPGRALGGPVEANQPYLVGEKGPELFVPRFAGTVVANSQMSTGNQTVNNYYINAIDTKSFEDRLLQSNKTVWAAHAYASKSLSPAGRI
jgi:SLT domain-containing protein